MEPTRERLQLLVNSLMSGEYQQTRGYLKRVRASESDDGDIVEAGHCCLGVGCDISGLGTWEEQLASDAAIYTVDPNKARIGRGYVTDKYEGANSPYYFPTAVAEWFGIDGKDIVFSWVPRDQEDTSLRLSTRGSSLNDARFTFAQIAQCIAYEFNLDFPEAVNV